MHVSIGEPGGMEWPTRLQKARATVVLVGVPSALALLLANATYPPPHGQLSLSHQLWWQILFCVFVAVSALGVIAHFLPYTDGSQQGAVVASPTIARSEQSTVTSVVGNSNVTQIIAEPSPHEAVETIALHMLYRRNKIEIHNDGARSLSLCGTQFNNGPHLIGPEPAIIPPLGSNAHHYLYADVLEEALRRLIPLDTPTDVPLSLFLKNDNGAKYVARFKLRSTVISSALGDSVVAIEPRLVGLDRDDWTDQITSAPVRVDVDIKALQTVTKLAARLDALAELTDTKPERKLGAVAEFLKWSNRNKKLLDQITPELIQVTTDVRLRYGFTDSALTDEKLTADFVPPGDMRLLAKGLRNIAARLSDRIANRPDAE